MRGQKNTPLPDDIWWATRAARGLGVYVHVPFCERRCGYCDFAAFAGLDELMESYVDTVILEIQTRVHAPASTLFVGGGTPSRLPPHLLRKLLCAVPKEAGAEVTVEMNPESASPAVIAAAAEGGATRLSFGMQSVRPKVLAFLDRSHSPRAVEEAVSSARSAGLAVNLDLIYGTPGESRQDWAASLEAALHCSPDHLSCYALTVEAPTALGKAVANGTKSAPQDDVCADRLVETTACLAKAGFTRYEISNWAREQPCRHNLRYWSHGAYVGVGCGAHSFDPVRSVRRWNVRHPMTYVERISACVRRSDTAKNAMQTASSRSGSSFSGDLSINLPKNFLSGPFANPSKNFWEDLSTDPWEGGHEVLHDKILAEERLMLGLRRVCGTVVPVDRVPSFLVEEGFCFWSEARLRLTEKGMLMAGEIVTELLLSFERW